MAESNPNKKTEEILVKKAKLLNSRKDRSVAFNALVIGVYGWHVSIPVVLGLFIGRYLDKNYPLPPMSWTFNMILLGFVIGFINANRWSHKEGIVNNMKIKCKEHNKRLKKDDDTCT
ncbi:MAG: AtpZ/AtpI family protein [Lactobacillales bacterium]|nr:AtpZ/AtpI family protein [Lactobacillales bacterium]